VVGPEAAVVTRAGGLVLQGIKNQAAGVPMWPNMHEAMMELHEILREWCDAAERTSATLTFLRSQRVPEARDALHWSNVGGRSGMSSVIPGGYLERTQRDIEAVVEPSAALLQRLDRRKRRQAARRSLRSLMRIYCPDLLEAFDTAVDGRAKWVRENRRTIVKAVRNGLPDSDLATLADGASQTAAELADVRLQLLTLIRERYPMGNAAD